MRSRGVPAGMLLALVVALTMSGCGSSTTVSTTVTTTVAAASRSHSTQSTSQSTLSTTSATSTETTSGSGSATSLGLCRARTLALSVLGQQGAMGHGELGFALRNTGTVSCHTFGYPGVLFLSRTGRPLPTVPTHTTHDVFGASSRVGLNVAPGHTVSFR